MTSPLVRSLAFGSLQDHDSCFSGRYIQDTAAYMWGLMTTAEMLSLVRAQRDSMLIRSLLSAMEASITQIRVSDKDAVFYALQACSDVKCISEGLQALDDHTFFTVR